MNPPTYEQIIAHALELTYKNAFLKARLEKVEDNMIELLTREAPCVVITITALILKCVLESMQERYELDIKAQVN